MKQRKNNIHYCYYCKETMNDDRLGTFFRVRRKESAVAHVSCRNNAVRKERDMVKQ